MEDKRRSMAVREGITAGFHTDANTVSHGWRSLCGRRYRGSRARNSLTEASILLAWTRLVKEAPPSKVRVS